MKILALAITMLAATAALQGPARAQDVDTAPCQQAAKAAADGSLAQIGNDVLKDKLCRVTSAAAQATESGDKAGREICGNASKALAAEFTRRFPDEDMDRVMERCQ
jgi:hypothetical protein